MPQFQEVTQKTETIRCANGLVLVVKYDTQVEGSGIPPRVKSIRYQGVDLDAGLFFQAASILRKRDKLADRVCDEHGDLRFAGEPGPDGIQPPASTCEQCRRSQRRGRTAETTDDDSQDDSDI